MSSSHILPSLPHLLLLTTSYSRDTPFAWGHVSLLCPLPSCVPQPRAAWEKALQHSAIAGILVFFSIFFWSQLRSTATHELLWRKWTTSQPKSIQLINSGIACHSWLGKMPHWVPANDTSPEVNCNVEHSYVTPVVLKLLLFFLFF